MKGILGFGVLIALISWGSVDAQDNPDWWKGMTLYQIYPRSFQDSDGDGIGDLRGITSRLPHLVDAGIDAFWLSPIYRSPMADFGYDIADFRNIDPIFGTLDDFDELVNTAHDLGLKVIMDLVPNHSSDEHEWFLRSLANEAPYSDYYTWHNGTVENGTRVRPNNWVSVFGGYAWSWRDERQAWYLHQFDPKQPDLNYRNSDLVQEMKDVFVYWMDRGADGFRVDAVPHLFEVESLIDEPLTGLTDIPTNYSYTYHDYTTNLDEVYDMVSQWGQVLRDYSDRTNSTRIMMIEAYTNISCTMRFYEVGAHFSFNFGFIENVDGSATAVDIKQRVIDDWLDNLPPQSTSNWVIGNHDQNRVASRFDPGLVDALNMVGQLLPGVGVTYYGEEIGMEDRWISWNETQDPQGCGATPDTFEAYSRDPARTPMQWDATFAAGFSSTNETWLPVHENYRTLNLAAQKEADVSHYKVYQAITTLKKEAVIQSGTVTVKLPSRNVLAFTRELDGSDKIVVVVNMVNRTEEISLDMFSSLPDTLTVSIASIHSSLTAGMEVSKSSFEISGMAGLVLRSGSNALTSSLVLTLFITLLAYFRH